jgi:hypothetical protein
MHRFLAIKTRLDTFSEIRISGFETDHHSTLAV